MESNAIIKRSKSCERCGKCFSKPALLRRHQVVHDKAKPFSCDSCPSQFSQQSSLQRHMRDKHTLHADSEGSKVAQQALDALRQLQAVATNCTTAQATLEEQPPCQLVMLKDKLNPNQESHLLPTQCIRRQMLNRCFYVCEYCAKEFSKTYDLIRHRRSHTKETPYPCSQCFKRFATRSKLNEHQTRQHETLKAHICSNCNASFTSINQLQKHLAEHHLGPDQQVSELLQLLPEPHLFQRSFKCVYCEKQFDRKFNCRTHMLTHLRRLLSVQPEEQALDSRHNCQQCGKNFQKPSDLARHLLTHSKLKLHECEVCQKRFTLKSTLARHLITHQAVRNPINCQVCGKSYASKSALNLHLRLHTGARPFTCEVCGETFRTSGHRLEHMRGERHKMINSNALIM